MFLRRTNGNRLDWTVYSIVTGIVRDSGRASTVENCLAQAGEGEDILLGQRLPAGTIVNPDGSTEKLKPEAVVATIADVKAFASKQLGYTDWYVTRSMEQDGKPVPDDILEIRARIRTRASAIEAMDPIPANFRDPQFWN